MGLPGCIPGPGDNAARPATAKEQGNLPGAAVAPRAGPRPSQPAGAQGRGHRPGGTTPLSCRRSQVASPRWRSSPRHQQLRKPTLWSRSAASWLVKATAFVAQATTADVAQAGRFRWWRLGRTPPAGPGIAEGSPPPAFAPAQGSPRSARPRDLLAAEQLQPPKLDRGWE